MADKYPIKAVSASGDATGLSEFEEGDAVPIDAGGTGAVTAESGLANLGGATESFVDAAVAAAVAMLVGSAPADLNTIEEIASALGNDPDILTNFLSTANVVNNLTSSDTEAPLSAAMGKALKDQLDTFNPLPNFTTNGSFSTLNPTLLFHETDATTDNGKWRIAIDNEQFNLDVVSDDGFTSEYFLRAERSSANVTDVTTNGEWYFNEDITALSNISASSLEITNLALFKSTVQLDENAYGTMVGSSTAGFVIEGAGSVTDFVLRNSLSQDVLWVPEGGLQINVKSDIFSEGSVIFGDVFNTYATFEGDGIEGVLLQGFGDTNDFMVRNRSGVDTLWLDSDTTEFTFAGDLSFSAMNLKVGGVSVLSSSSSEASFFSGVLEVTPTSVQINEGVGLDFYNGNGVIEWSDAFDTYGSISGGSAGMVIQGFGFLGDIILRNSAATDVMLVPTGTTDVEFKGDVYLESALYHDSAEAIVYGNGNEVYRVNNSGLVITSQIQLNDSRFIRFENQDGFTISGYIGLINASNELAIQHDTELSVTIGAAETFTVNGSLVTSQVDVSIDTGDLYLNSPDGHIWFTETDAAADNGKWDFRYYGGKFEFRTVNDAVTGASTIMDVSRTGIGVDLISFFAETTFSDHITLGNNKAIFIKNSESQSYPVIQRFGDEVYIDSYGNSAGNGAIILRTRNGSGAVATALQLNAESQQAFFGGIISSSINNAGAVTLGAASDIQPGMRIFNAATNFYMGLNTSAGTAFSGSTANYAYVGTSSNGLEFATANVVRAKFDTLARLHLFTELSLDSNKVIALEGQGSDTYFYGAGTNNIYFVTGGANVLRLDNNQDIAAYGRITIPHTDGYYFGNGYIGEPDVNWGWLLKPDTASGGAANGGILNTAGVAIMLFYDANKSVTLSTSSTLHSGFRVDNGTNLLCEILGFSGANDSGGVRLYSGGVPRTDLYSDQPSYFYHGIRIPVTSKVFLDSDAGMDSYIYASGNDQIDIVAGGIVKSRWSSGISTIYGYTQLNRSAGVNDAQIELFGGDADSGAALTFHRTSVKIWYLGMRGDSAAFTLRNDSAGGSLVFGVNSAGSFDFHTGVKLSDGVPTTSGDLAMGNSYVSSSIRIGSFGSYIGRDAGTGAIRYRSAQNSHHFTGTNVILDEHLIVQGGKFIYLDGGSDTYISQLSGNETSVVSGGTEGLRVGNNFTYTRNFRPFVNNLYAMGDASFAWTVVYATNGAIQPSDLRLKNVTKRLTPEEALSFVRDTESIEYYWKDDASKVYRHGFGAQEIYVLLKKHGMNPDKNGLVSHDVSSDKWSMGYSEMVSINSAAIRGVASMVDKVVVSIGSHNKKIKALEEKVDTLEEEVRILKAA